LGRASVASSRTILRKTCGERLAIRSSSNSLGVSREQERVTYIVAAQCTHDFARSIQLDLDALVEIL
jgi:hypothetical protein